MFRSTTSSDTRSDPSPTSVHIGSISHSVESDDNDLAIRERIDFRIDNPSHVPKSIDWSHLKSQRPDRMSPDPCPSLARASSVYFLHTVRAYSTSPPIEHTSKAAGGGRHFFLKNIFPLIKITTQSPLLSFLRCDRRCRWLSSCRFPNTISSRYMICVEHKDELNES